MISNILINPTNIELKKQHDKRISVSTTLIEPIYKGKDVFIIGGGNSLSNFNFELLRDKSIIAINRSFIKVPFAEVLYFSDHRFYLWATGQLDNDIELIENYKKFKGLKYSIINKVKDQSVIILKNTGKTGIDLRNGCIRHGGNSGYAAINLAYHLGAKNIILMGYDMKSINGKIHFHNGYVAKQTDSVYKGFLEPYFTMKEIIESAGVKIYNTSMDSNLTVFEKKRIEHFL